MDNRGIIQVGSTADHLKMSGAYRTLIGAWAMIGTEVATARVRLKSAGLDEMHGTDQSFLPYINGGGSGDVEPGTPQAFNDLRATPWALPPSDEIRCLHFGNQTDADDQSVIGIWSDGGVPSPVSPQGGFWARATTAASALTAGAWGNRAITWATSLKPGKYELLAGRVVSATLIAAGAVGSDGTGNRAPLFAADSPADLPHAAFAVPGQFGVLQRFDSNTPFSLDLLANDADNQVQDCLFYVRRYAAL